jgi:DNA-binding CsgD family transcriptional regulator
MTPLTSRESEIVSGIAAGMSSKVLARKLSISPKTVDTHRARAMKKLDAHNVVDLVRYALRLVPTGHCKTCTCGASLATASQPPVAHSRSQQKRFDALTGEKHE